MQRISKSSALIALLAWVIGVGLLLPLNEWLRYDRQYSGPKFICVLVGLFVIKGIYSAFKKDRITEHQVVAKSKH
jgi:Na+/glutamate symporter